MRSAVPDAEVDIWHCNGNGLYENQDATQAAYNLRGKFSTDADGKVHFRTVKPAGYPIPVHTVVGRMLQLQERHPFRPAHVHAMVFKPGYKTLITQIYAADDPRLDTDVQFGATQALSAPFEQHLGPHPTHADLVGPWFSLQHTLVITPGEARLPVPPIK
jgi:catechol 1,2-dioxygenase